MLSTLFFPGLNGSEHAHWQSQWQRHLPDAYLVPQSDWARPDLEDWLGNAVAAIHAHPHAILIGHSLGAILIAHLAARYPDLPVAGALLVAPADIEGDHPATCDLQSFALMPMEPFDFRSIVVASTNDPFMNFDRARVLANIWEAAFVDLGAAGHINLAGGYGPWPEGLALLERFLPQRQRRRIVELSPKGTAPFEPDWRQRER